MTNSSPKKPRDGSFYDAFLLFAYGGPETPEEIGPFLDRLLAGKNVPPMARRNAEAKYRKRGGSPIHGECRSFLHRLEESFRDILPDHPPAIYWGNLYSEPLLEETVTRIFQDGRKNVLTLIASPFGSPQSCRRYGIRLEAAISNAQDRENVPPGQFPHFHPIPPFFTDPDFLRACADLLLPFLAEDRLSHLHWGTNPSDSPLSPKETTSGGSHPLGNPESPPLLLFSAHSLPLEDARTSRYEDQLLWTCERLAGAIGLGNRLTLEETNPPAIPSEEGAPIDSSFGIPPRWNLVYQSRSGRPDSPWTGPGIEDFLRDYRKAFPTARRILIFPIGFFFENMETVADLDDGLTPLAEELDFEIRRVPTVGRSQRMIEMVLRHLKSAPFILSCDPLTDGCSLTCQPVPFRPSSRNL